MSDRHVWHVTRTWDDGEVETFTAPWPEHSPKDAYWSDGHLTITRRSAVWAHTETLRLIRCAPYVYPIPHDDDATEYGAECACGWRIDGVSRETAQREADEHGGCDE